MLTEKELLRFGEDFGRYLQEEMRLQWYGTRMREAAFSAVFVAFACLIAWRIDLFAVALFAALAVLLSILHWQRNKLIDQLGRSRAMPNRGFNVARLCYRHPGGNLPEDEFSENPVLKNDLRDSRIVRCRVSRGRLRYRGGVAGHCCDCLPGRDDRRVRHGRAVGISGVCRVAQIADQRQGVTYMATLEHLKKLHADLTARIIACTLDGHDPADVWQSIKGYHDVRRIITVAAATRPKLTVLISGPAGSGKTMLSRAAAGLDVIVNECRPCPCGYFTDVRHPCSCSSSDIKRYHRRASIRKLRLQSDMHYSVVIPSVAELERDRNGWPPLEETVEVVRRSLDLPDPEWRLDDASKNLIAQAQSELGLDGHALSRIPIIADAIARIGNDAVIRLEHIAEAIHYTRRY